MLINNLDSSSNYFDKPKNSEITIIINQIRDYAIKIQCPNFNKNASIDDYIHLFAQALQIANETNLNMFLYPDDDLIEIFSNFFIEIRNVNVINDITFCKSVLLAVKQIYDRFWKLQLFKYQNNIII